MESGIARKLGFRIYATDGSVYASATAPTVTISRIVGTTAPTAPVAPAGAITRSGSTNLWFWDMTAAEMTADLLIIEISGSGIRVDSYPIALEANYTAVRAARIDATISSAVTAATNANTAATLAAERAGREWIAKLTGLTDEGSDNYSFTVADGAFPPASGGVASMLLYSPGSQFTWPITSYTPAFDPGGGGEIVAAFITVAAAHDVTLLSAGTTFYVGRPESGGATTSTTQAVSAALFLEIAGASSMGCGCSAKSACGCGNGGEARLYEGDTRDRVFFLRDSGGSVVALPAGVAVQIWDNAAKIGDATIAITDSARWSGTISIPTAVWDDLTPGIYWLRTLDGDDQIVSVTPLTVLDPAGVGTGW